MTFEPADETIELSSADFESGIANAMTSLDEREGMDPDVRAAMGAALAAVSARGIAASISRSVDFEKGCECALIEMQNSKTGPADDGPYATSASDS